MGHYKQISLDLLEERQPATPTFYSRPITDVNIEPAPAPTPTPPEIDIIADMWQYYRIMFYRQHLATIAARTSDEALTVAKDLLNNRHVHYNDYGLRAVMIHPGEQ